ncbi:hypothetical protein [Desulfocurvibacter africanus]|uniref:Uncharacterized protein n=2 Tax=Desulfocurvibacter africanus TaxID=873 RepID=F3YY26_DESAF|nr:hypothetical protein [Desulfocurvibacter africanus]EGJ51802.1 hypothetical protein Desaf_3520 [Desulfocurvibacter africanus subsp. africanus str. Walvis Bay]
MPKLTLPSGAEVEFCGLSFEAADAYLARESELLDESKSDHERIAGRRQLMRETLEQTCPEAWARARQSNRDVAALHRAVLAETFGSPDTEKNS